MSRTDSPREYNARILSSKPWKAALALAHDLRLEAAVAIARGLDRHPPVLGHQRLRRRAIARVVGAARWLVTGLIAQVVGQLGTQRPFHEPTGEIGQQSAGPDDLLLRAGAGKQLVDQPIREPVPEAGRKLVRNRPPRRARRAGISRASPSGLAALNAGASPVVLHIDPAVRVLGGHDPPIRSCLHSSSDSPQWA